MNSAIILKKETKRNFFDFPIKKELKYISGKELNVYYINRDNPGTYKKLIKRLKKDNIKKLAVDESISSEKLTEFEIITKDRVFKKNIADIVKKLTGTLGIKSGNLNLGIIADDITLRNFIPLAKKLKTVFLYSEIKDADIFCKETGVPVITKSVPAENECEILVVGKSFFGVIPETVRCIVETGKTDLKDSRCISDIRFKELENTLPDGVRNCVVNELLGDGGSIAGFVKKTLDTRE